MKNLKLKVISKYLRPYKKEFIYGSLALLVVNILSVVIPLEVKNIIDQLQKGFSFDFVANEQLTIWNNRMCFNRSAYVEADYLTTTSLHTTCFVNNDTATTS